MKNNQKKQSKHLSNGISANQYIAKLRNKELTMGCICKTGPHRNYSRNGWRMPDGERYWTFICAMYYKDNVSNAIHEFNFIEAEGAEVMGHPLTYGQICYKHRIDGGDDERSAYFNAIVMIFHEFPELYNQDETEWIKHEKRPELKNLLMTFSNYI